ncbi:MAG TPA: carboxypeptidase-like regulatory domain-containing protein, partial [Vicinamibacterales bacterium]|nr:carboxypeptidase-like regulatory domain-containing protein [Vicinamibacterales bacterium]
MAAASSRRLLRAASLAAFLAAGCSHQPSAPTSTGDATPVPTGTLHGIVRDAIPTASGAPVAGVFVQVLDQSGAGPSTTTDANGEYRLSGIPQNQTLQLRVSRDGYQAASKSVALSGDDGSADVLITPIVVSVFGVVTEAPPSQAPVAAAVLTIVSGSKKGWTYSADGAGAFRLDSVWGEFDVSVARAGYDTITAHVVAYSGLPVTVRMTPQAGRVSVAFAGSLCTTEKLPPWLNCTAPFERTHVLSITRPGPVALTVDYVYVGDYYVNSLMLDIRCGSRVVAQKKFVKQWEAPPTVMPDNVVGTFEVALNEACEYDLRLWNFVADTKGGSQTTYRVAAAYA